MTVDSRLALSEELIKLTGKLTTKQIETFKQKVSSLRDYELKVGILGKAGVGKSSLCNTLFGREEAKVSHLEAGTLSPQDLFLPLSGEKGIKLIDCPGVGESDKKDKEYEALYRKLIPQLDLVLWVVKADNSNTRS